jgi:hypothetical protein
MKFIDLKKNKEYYIFYFSIVDELKTFSAHFYNREDKIFYKPPKLYKAKFNQIVGSLTQSHIMLDFYITYNKKMCECYPQLKVDVLFPIKVEKESQILGDKILCSRGNWIIAEDKQTIKQILRNIYKATTSYTAHKDEEGHIYYTRSTIYVTKKTRENYQESIKALKRDTV